MAGIFDNVQIKNMTLRNRFVRSATWEGMAGPDGSCTPQMTEMMGRLVRGGVGLIITGYSYVHSWGQAGPYQLGIDRDELIPGYRKMTDYVHKEGGKIVLQLAHGGCHSNPKLTEQEPIGPSTLQVDGKSLCREMSNEEITHTVSAFAEAAERAKKAGFDGVQIHAAHGYLLSQFLSPFYNRRADEYGGSMENRSRILLESYRAVRNAVGNVFPVLIKINSEDFLENGFKMEEMIKLAFMLEKAGIDAIELSGGTILSDKNLVAVRPGKLDSEDQEVYYRGAAIRLKENKLNLPLMLVGGIRSYSVAEKLVGEGIADIISLSRPLIREPDLVNRWKSGDRSKAACISCNACFRPGIKGEGVYCVVRKKEEDNKRELGIGVNAAPVI